MQLVVHPQVPPTARAGQANARRQESPVGLTRTVPAQSLTASQGRGQDAEFESSSWGSDRLSYMGCTRARQ